MTQHVVVLVAALILGGFGGYALCIRNTHRARKCVHGRQRGIYGDEIYMAGNNRGRCLDCGELLPNIPTEEKNAYREDLEGELMALSKRRKTVFTANWPGECSNPRCPEGEFDAGDRVAYIDDEIYCEDCAEELA